MSSTNPRHLRLLDLLASHGEKSVSDLVRSLKVSDMTVRRDLAALERAGRLERTWGGAVIADRQMVEFSFRDKERRNQKQKEAIGCKAASLVQPGQSVFIDTGTTALQVARALREHTSVRVFTCSLPIVAALLNCSGVTTVMLGGSVRSDSLEVYGPLTERNFADLRTDVAVLGADAVGPQGELYTGSMETSRVSELILQVAGRKVLVADATKFGTTSASKYGDIASLTTIITDKSLAPDRQRLIAHRKVELILV